MVVVNITQLKSDDFVIHEFPGGKIELGIISNELTVVLFTFGNIGSNRAIKVFKEPLKTFEEIFKFCSIDVSEYEDFLMEPRPEDYLIRTFPCIKIYNKGKCFISDVLWGMDSMNLNVNAYLNWVFQILQQHPLNREEPILKLSLKSFKEKKNTLTMGEIEAVRRLDMYFPPDISDIILNYMINPSGYILMKYYEFINEK
jgi:hypothetical protein